VNGETLDVLPRLIRRPDVAEITERDAPLLIMRVAHEPRLFRRGDRRGNEEKRDCREVNFLHHFFQTVRKLKGARPGDGATRLLRAATTFVCLVRTGNSLSVFEDTLQDLARAL
jgi:hypothetical protein